MAAALHEQDFLCRIFGRCLAGDPIDREVSDVIRQGIPGVPKLFTYVRYNPDLSREGLATLCLDHMRPEHVQQMDSVAYISEMQEVGPGSRAALCRYECRFQLKRRLSHFQRYFLQLNRDYNTRS